VTDVRPFRALRYDTARVDLARVLAPPYDVISPEERAAFYDGDPHNAIRLTLTRSVEDEADTDYTEVRRTLDAWRSSGVMVLDAQPALYALRQTFRAPDGTRHTREGFFGLLHLEDYARRVVRPHERTLAAPRADRLKLLRAARANLSSIFLLFEDRERAAAELLGPAFEGEPLARVEDASGALHSLAALRDPQRIERVRAFLAQRPVVIADGHHRYETALAYRDARRAADGSAEPEVPSEWALAYFANAYAPGMLLLPIHRLILKGSMPSEDAWRERLPGWREASVAAASAEALPALLARHLEPLRDAHAFALDDASGRLRIFSRPRAADDALSVRVVHREVIEGVFGLDEDALREGAIAYPKSAEQTARDVRAGRGAVAIYLNALAPEDVFRVTAAGDVLPQKSTFFYPKLPTGLLFRCLEPA
jgi:uncharacterized protein (DUF1015 family)